MASPTLRAVGTFKSYGGNNESIDKPVGTLEGDLMVAFLASDGPNTPTSWATRIPSGWTVIQDDPSTNAFLFSGCVAYKLATASEPTSYVFNFGAQMGGGGIIAYSGVNSASPINVSAQQTNASASTAHPIPSITTTVADCLVVGYYRHTSNNGVPYTEPGGWTERADYKAATANCNFGVSDKVFASAGATGTVSATGNLSNETWCVAFAIAPDAGGGGTPSLVVSDGSHAHAADNLSLTIIGTLSVADAAHAHTADSITLTATSNGTIAIPAVRDWGTKALKTGQTGVQVDIRNITTGALVVRKTGQTTHATTGVCVVTDAAIVAGTTYEVVTRFADGSRGMWDYTAS